MAAERNDGGPAFAATYEEYDADMERWRIVSSGGMTLRDYFAAMALQGILAQSLGTVGGSDPALGAVMAYNFADAMLKAREA